MLRRLFAAISGAILLITATAVSANASSNHGLVVNQTGASVSIDCSLAGAGHQDHVIYEVSKIGKPHRSDYWADCSDADAFKVNYDWRCINLKLLGWDAYHEVRIMPGRWFKLPGLARAYVYAYKGCSSAPWISGTLQRV